MPTMTNPETGETKEISMEEFIEAMKNGNVSVSQEVHHSDGTVTSSVVYGNNVGDGIDRSVNIFATMNDIFIAAKKAYISDGSDESVFIMDDADKDYEVVIDDTTMPIMHIVKCTSDGVSVSRYIRDEQKTVGQPIEDVNIEFEDGRIVATLEEVTENNLALFAFGIFSIRQMLKENGMLQELQKIGNKCSGVTITSKDENIIAKIVRGMNRPELPCLLFGGILSQGMEDAIMLRPYPDELINDTFFSDLTIEEKIQAAEDGDPNLMEELAQAYLNGFEVEPDFKKAVYWFEKLAETGNSTAMFNVGLHYAKGCGVERNFQVAAEWMQKASELGDEDAPFLYEKYIKAYESIPKAQNGDAQAQADLAGILMELAHSLEQSDTLETDYKESFELALKSSAQNNGDGLWILALAYEHGRGTEQDVAKAVECYKKGAEIGHSKCQHSLGCYYMRGDFLNKDDAIAFDLFLKSAQQGYNLAYFSLAKCYELGNGIEEDLDLALEWGEKAAMCGDSDVQYEVAKMYTYTDENGRMINSERAKYWLNEAAEKGHEMAYGMLNFEPMWEE